uniref:Uncharacterized protein n=1 Tax=Rhipicephalus zambeziensis TaxID=60191 RepID=A0A224YKF9_9ACAR
MEKKGRHSRKANNNCILPTTSLNCLSLIINKAAFISAEQMRKLLINLSTIFRRSSRHGLRFCSFHSAVKKSCRRMHSKLLPLALNQE